MTKSRDKWIQGAISKPGALTAKADKAHMTPMAYAEAHKGDPGRTGKQARLAITLKGLGKR